jgi:hypothetical protein
VERFNKVVARLKQSRICLAIDEGHHMGPRCLNLLKTLINQTPGEIAVFAKETLWTKLELAAYEEVKQLTKNRLAERVVLGCRPRDIEKLLDRRINWHRNGSDRQSGSDPRAVKMLIDRVKLGNLAFTREVIKRVNEMAEGEPVTIELFTTAVDEEAKSR